MKDVVKTTLVLVVIAVIAGALLAGVSAFTAIDEQEVLDKKLSAAYDCAEGFSADLSPQLGKDAITDADLAAKGSVNGIYRPKDGSDKIIFLTTGKGAYKSTIQLLIVIGGDEIVSLTKYASNETPGLGSKAFEKEYLDQFKKNIKDIDSFATNKAGGDIDAVSGATKTSTAVVNAVNAAVNSYKVHKDALLALNISGGDAQ